MKWQFGRLYVLGAIARLLYRPKYRNSHKCHKIQMLDF